MGTNWRMVFEWLATTVSYIYIIMLDLKIYLSMSGVAELVRFSSSQIPTSIWFHF